MEKEKARCFNSTNQKDKKNNFMETILRRDKSIENKKRENRRKLNEVYNLRSYLQKHKRENDRSGRMGYINRMVTKKEPITSYGILLFHHDTDNQIWYLLSQRRDTIEYTDYIRGKYTIPNLENYFRLMTVEERERLENYNFNELWDDLWINHDNNFYREIKPKAENKYELNKHLMMKYLRTTISDIKEPSWGFPKGKKNTRETDLQCAFREFKEETKMPIDYLNLLNIPASKEIFKGSDGKMYSTIYYIAQTDGKKPINKIKTRGIRTETISEEISNLKWCTLGESLILLPIWRQRLLVDAEIKIRNYLNEDTMALKSTENFVKQLKS